MTQQIINTGNAANDGTGESLRSAFVAVNENFTEIYTAGPVGTNVSITGNVITVLGPNNNLVLKGNGVGNIQANSSIVPSLDGVHDLGSPRTRFDTAYATYFVGNGSLLTGIVVSGGTAIVNGDSNVNVAANSVVTIGISGTGNVVTFDVANTVFNTSISATGNVTGTYFIGNGALLTGIAAGGTSNISNGTSNVTVANNGNITIGIAGATVTTFTGTGEYVTGIISATGNVKGNYFVGNGSQLSNVLTVSQYTTGNISNVVPNVHGLLFDTTTGFSVTDMGNGNALITLGSSFKTWEVAGQTSLVAVGEDTVQFVDGNNIVITTNALSTPQQIKFSLSDNVSVLGNVTSGNFRTTGSVSATGNITSNYFIGNGSQLTGIASSYGNANVVANLAALGTNPISTTGNITGNYFIGNGSQLTGITSSYGNANVVANLAALGNNPVSTTGNITGSYFIGNGSQLTGIVSSYSNANVAANLAAFGNNPISTTGNVTAGNLNAAGLSLSSNVVSNLNVTANIASGNIITPGLISAAGNITGGNLTTTGLTRTKDFAITGNITGNLIPSANVTYNIGDSTHAFKDLYLSGNSIYLGSQTISSDASGISVSSGNFSANNLSAVNSIAAGTVISAVGNITGGNLNAAGLSLSSNVISNLNVTANIASGNITTPGLISAIGNLTSGNLKTTGLISANGNIIGSNISITGGTLAFANANIIQTNPLDLAITGAYQISIKPGGGSYQWTFGNDGGLSGPYITATGNITGGNLLTSGLISAAGNITGGNVNTNNIVGTAITITSTGALNLVSTGNITVNSKNITNLADPVQDQDAATKYYVDSVAQGLDPKASVSLATAATLPAYTYNNGTAGVGATITASSSGLLTIDGTSPAVGSRVLIKNETGANQPYNGIYTVTTNSAGAPYVLTRAADFNQSTEVAGAFTFVEEGSTNADSGWVCTTNAPVVIGTTNIVFTQFSSAGSYTANTAAGLSLVGSVFNAKIDNTTTAFDSSGNIIVKTGATFTTPNIGAATGTSVSVTGNVTSGNLNAAGLSLSSNVVSNLSVTANIAGGNILTAGLISATGNVAGNYFIGNGSLLTGISTSGGTGNTITLGTPTDGSLSGNTVAYQGWTANTYVTDGLDDLNQVSLNIAGNTFVGNTYITSNVYSGPSPLSVSLTGRYIGNPNSYLWQFGDGTANAATANATHTFSNTLGGTYTVTYTAYNTNGTNAGNAAAGAKGSTSTATATITLYTPTPIPSFTANRTSLDTPNGVQITNSSQYAETYSINWGDGTVVIPANNWTTATHTFTNATANTDALYGVNLTGNSANAGASPVSVTSSNTNVKVYSSQASNVFVTANVANVINGVGTISFRNDSTGTPGNTASFGAQQLYNFNWGDGTVSNVNIAAGTAGNPGAANVTHAFALSAANQSGNKYEQYTANLYLYTGFSTSPAKSGNITITIEPQTRANFVGTTANVTTDATANIGNARVGYLYTDYNGANRSTFTFQNTSENSNIANWAWGDSTFSNGVSNVGNVVHTYTTTGAKTVSLTANGTPNGITSTAQSNTFSTTGYIFIAANPTAPTNLSGFANLTIANASQYTNAPLLAAGATDASGGNIPANGTSVTRFATTTPVMTSANVLLANTSTTGTLTAYVNNAAAGNVTFTTSGNTVGTTSALVVAADQDLHVANAAVPSYFYKVFSANISCALANLSTGYNNYKLSHTVSGNTNYVGFVKDNLNSVPTLSNSSVVMTEATAGTVRYISGIPYYNTGSPTVTIANLQVANLAGQTFTSTNPFILDSGTVYEGSGSVVAASQTKSLAGIDNTANSMLTSSNVKANIGIGSNYTLGNLTANLGGTNNSVSTLQANILNVVGTSATVQLPTKIQMYAGANSGVNEQSITASTTGNTQAAVRVVMSSAGNTPAFANSINYYTSNAWSGAQTIANTPEAVVRYGTLTNYTVNLSTGYLPVGPNLAVGGNRTSTQYFTFAFARPSLANFDIRLTSTTGIAGLWIAAPNTTIDTGGFSSPTPGFPGPTSTINGWLEGFTQYSGSGVPGASATGGNGSNGCALTGADVVPLNTSIASVAYTMTLGSQNAANSFGNNILVRIALASGQTITALSIGTAT